MRTITLLLEAIMMALLFCNNATGQNLLTSWEDLTSGDFVRALKKADGVCVIPMGVIEKHGPHLPLGTDVFVARHICMAAAQKEYCIVYPYFFAGQIYEAQHQPGTVAYSPELIYSILDQTCAEIARNGIKKILIFNTHGGNNYLLEYFMQAQLSKQKDYIVYLAMPDIGEQAKERIEKARVSHTGGHADEVETSNMLVIRPDLVNLQMAKNESGTNQIKQDLTNLLTGIGWYSKYPNHYAGESSGATKQLGEISLDARIKNLEEIIKRVKTDSVSIVLQRQFFNEMENPLKTPKR
jgi:creatinine amidohydrolase